MRIDIMLSEGSVQLLNHVQLFVTPWTAARQASLSITNSQSLLKVMSIESMMPSNHLILCYPLLLPPSIFPSLRVFSNESVLCIRWPKYWSFSFSISACNEFSGLISFGMDQLDLLAVQGTLKYLLQHHSSNASILRCSAFFTVQLSHLYMTTDMFQCCSLNWSHTLLPTHSCVVCKSFPYVCISTAALQIDSSVLFFQISYICINIQFFFPDLPHSL